jgi:hypothetical protein
MTTHSESRNDDPEHIAAVAKVAEKRGCDWPGHPCGRDIPEFNGRDAECVCETITSRGELVMGNGGPCMSCGGNDGYGPAPHHTPECYFASNEDAEHAG